MNAEDRIERIAAERVELDRIYGEGGPFDASYINRLVDLNRISLQTIIDGVPVYRVAAAMTAGAMPRTAEDLFSEAVIKDGEVLEEAMVAVERAAKLASLPESARAALTASTSLIARFVAASAGSDGGRS